MQARAAYTILCSECHEKFPIVVMIDPEKKAKEGVSSREVICPFCQSMLTFSLNETIAPDQTVLKTYKKIEK